MNSRARACATLAEYRLNVLGLRQGELAARLGVAQSTISKAEHGRMPKPWTCDAMARALNMPRTELERLVRNAAQMRALRTPAEEAFPLLTEQRADGRAAVIELATDEDLRAAGGCGA